MISYDANKMLVNACSAFQYLTAKSEILRSAADEKLS